jgi:serine/threonine-protein kinase
MARDDALTQISAEPLDAPEAPKPTVAGQQVGRYRLAFEVASGGMATVYLATLIGPAGFDKVFALKRIHSHLAKQKNYVEMFLDEARLAARIQHPNVCSVVDFGEEDGEYFLAMEYLLGVPLSFVLSVLSRRKDAQPERWPAIAGRLIQDACEGLHAAHELTAPDGSSLGVVHRDVSPQNLFVGFDGVLKVVDFGIAKAADKASVTRTLELKGKVAYMAPEQIRKGEVGRSADVFALGVVFWEMLTLKRLFRRSSQVDTMYAALESPILSPSECNDAAPTALDPVVQGALARDVAARTKDARTFGREIGRVFGRELEEQVDRGEIAQLMAELFPGEEKAQRELIEAARTQEEPPGRISVPHDVESFTDGQTVLARRTSRRAKPPKRRGAMLWASLSVVALGVGGAGWLFASGDRDGEDVVDAHHGADAAAPIALASAHRDGAVAAEARDASHMRASDARTSDGDDARIAASSVEETPAATMTRRRGRRNAMETREAVESGEAATGTADETGPGTLVVVVPGGWANVYETRLGRLLGATPLTTRLPAGRHTLELRFGGQPPPVAVTVDIEAGETFRLTRRAP